MDDEHNRELGMQGSMKRDHELTIKFLLALLLYYCISINLQSQSFNFNLIASYIRKDFLLQKYIIADIRKKVTPT